MVLSCFASFACFAVPSFVFAQVRSSTNYAISSESFTSGLVQGASANYKLDSSTEVTATGIATAAAYTNRQGHIAQLTDPVSIVINAAADPVNEATNNQLTGVLTNDDTTTTNLGGAEILWSIVSGPIDSINAGGLASLSAVYQDENATAQGDYNGVSDQVVFQVTNSDPDNFGAYGGDGLEDGWQVTYFGAPPNAEAGPGADPDGDGRDNFFENLSGFDPTDPTQRFTLNVLGFSAATTLDLELNKVIPGTKYTIYRNGDMLGTWTGIGVLTPGATEFDKLFQDSAASADRNFYDVTLEKN